MLHRTGTRRLHTAKQLNPKYANGNQDLLKDNRTGDRASTDQVGRSRITEYDWTQIDEKEIEWKRKGRCSYETSIVGNGWDHYQREWTYVWRLHGKKVK